MAVFCPFVSSLDTSYLTFLFQDTHFKTFPKLSFIFDDNLLFRTFRIQKIYVIWQKLRLKLTWCFDQFRNQTLPLPKFTLTLISPHPFLHLTLTFSITPDLPLMIYPYPYSDVIPTWPQSYSMRTLTPVCNGLTLLFDNHLYSGFTPSSPRELGPNQIE